MAKAAPQSREADGTVGKALAVLDQIAEAGRPMRFGEVLAASVHPKATLYRLVQTLTNQGMLSYDETHQTYAPGLRLVRLAHAAWRQSALAPVARPYLDQLSADVGETIHLAQLDRGQVLYVDKRNAETPIEMFSQAGKIGPGYCTGVGKAMIAHLSAEAQADAIRRQAFFAHTAHTLATPEALLTELAEIRHDGVAFDREEHEPGIICIAAPILSEAGKVMGGLSITSSVQRQSLEGLTALRPALLQTAKDIATAAETWQFPS
ncbi:IclR family transcriptional regulator [Phaeobacter sp. HS012]|uniref:IclR family transcriptional regulator n=1 Tax=unclassified Phaeobacter TaxID=2621772 RepID=UPI001B35B85A|nr:MULTISPECIES: IclR family transcriptional regulator [unclassified Phaeobacter]MBQ4805893.1 IclR family transcriptional regulator [Phaeobacter sp. HS012]MBQ4880743.1 IclR family transcriptional regulator [Phaeobacter sp. HS011]